MRVVATGAAQRTGVRAQNRAEYASVGRLKDVRAEHLFRRPVVTTKDADSGLQLPPRRLLLAPPVRGDEQVVVQSGGKAAPARRRGVSGGGRWPEERDAFPELVDGDGRRGAAVVVAVTAALRRLSFALPYRAHQARAHRVVAVLQAQRRLQGLGYGVGAAGRSMGPVGGHQRGQAEVVVPEVEGVVAGGRRAQVPVLQDVHGRGGGVTDGCPERPRAAGMW